MNVNQILQHVVSDAMTRKNPIVANAYQMYQQGNTQGLKQLAENVCKEKGVTPESIVQQFGLNR